MDNDLGRMEATSDHRFLDPKHDVVTCTAFIIPEIVIKADLGDIASFKKSDGFIWPEHSNPAFWGFSFVVEEDVHAWAFRCAFLAMRA